MIFDHGKFEECYKNHSILHRSGILTETDSLHIWVDGLIKHTFIKIQKGLLVEVAVCTDRVKAFHMIKATCKVAFVCACVFACARLGSWWDVR